MSAMGKLTACFSARHQTIEPTSLPAPEPVPFSPAPMAVEAEPEYVSNLEYEITVYTHEAVAISSLIRMAQAGGDVSVFAEEMLSIAVRLERKIRKIAPPEEQDV